MSIVTLQKKLSWYPSILPTKAGTRDKRINKNKEREMQFIDRADAGKQLAKQLQDYANKSDVIVIGLPRGGVIPAFEVAQALNLPLDIVVPRKLGAPYNPELAVGAITEDGTIIFNESIMRQLNLSPTDLTPIIEAEKEEAARRLSLYRSSRPPLDMNGKTVLLVDDGIATGATMRAAIASARARGAKKIIVAIPVAPADTINLIKQEVDDLICLLTPIQFWGVGGFYNKFTQTTDNEVIELMQKAKAP